MKKVILHTYIDHLWTVQEKTHIRALFRNYDNVFLKSLCCMEKKALQYPTAVVASYSVTNNTIRILNTVTKGHIVIGSYATASFLSSFDNFHFGLDQLFLPLNTKDQLPLDQKQIGLVAGDDSSDGHNILCAKYYTIGFVKNSLFNTKTFFNLLFDFFFR